MLKGFFQVPKAVNEPVKGMHQIHLKKPFKQLILKCGILKLMYLFISSEEIRTGILEPCPHHDHKHIVGTYHLAENRISKKPLQMH
jgi:1-pyrroline-5-carboxylate dehydrogenase